MTLMNLLINLFLAAVLYFSNGILGYIKGKTPTFFNYTSFSFEKVDSRNFAEHFFHKIVHPAIFLAVASALLERISKTDLICDLWLVVPFFWGFRLLHIVIWDYSSFTNWTYEFTSMFLSIMLGEGTLFLILCPLIDAGESVFIDPSELRDAFWIAAISYLLKLSWDIAKSSLVGYTVFPSEKRSRTILKRYDNFKWKYGIYINDLLDTYSFDSQESKEYFMCLVYSIMIYEDHCRPKTIRALEYVVKFFRPFSTMSLGIMQVQTKRIISNRTSIKLAIAKLHPKYTEADLLSRLYDPLIDYNGLSYYREVRSIFCSLSRSLGLAESDLLC